MKIGFFDSGIGGISVLHQAMCDMPDEEFLYYADTEHVPYGLKTKEQIKSYVEDAINFMIAHEVKAIVIACNTATSVAIDYLRDKFDLPIIGMEPAVKPAISHHTDQRILVVATPVTVREEKLHKLLVRIDKKQQVDLLPLPGLVTFAEKGEFTSDHVIRYLQQETAPFRLEEYSSLVFGCTHFKYFQDSFEKVFPDHITYIDGSKGTVNRLKEILKSNHLLEQNKQSVTYYQSGVLVKDSGTLSFYKTLQNRIHALTGSY